MVAAAAREIHDGDKVFVGMRLPLLGFAVAKETRAPNAIGIFENGVIRDWPALESIFTMSDPPNVAGALSCSGLNDVMFLLQTGRVDLGFIGGAEIDRFGNLNTHWVEENGKPIRLPGGGPSRVITSMGVFGFAPDSREMILISHHPGIAVEQVKNETGWPLRVADGIHETLPPTDTELAAVRKYDPKKVWTA